MNRGADVHELIDKFVEKVNQSSRKRIREEDLPPGLRQGKPEFGLYYDWRIQKSGRIDWIDPLESKLPTALPPSYRSFVTRYLFPAFEADSLILLANTGQVLYHEMRLAIFRDTVLAQVLVKNGFIQFARPGNGHYDPVCFDTKRCIRDGEYPIVRIDYAEILRRSAIKVTEHIAPSFTEFANRYLQTPSDRPACR
jgi:hypothetical protein